MLKLRLFYFCLLVLSAAAGTCLAVGDLKNPGTIFNRENPQQHQRNRSESGSMKKNNGALPAIFSTHEIFTSEERELGVKIGDIETTGMKLHLTGIKLIGELPEKCEIDSRWIKGSVTYSQTDKGILIETSEVIKKNKFTNAELKSAEFKTLIKKIKNCHSLRQLIYKPLGKS